MTTDFRHKVVALAAASAIAVLAALAFVPAAQASPPDTVIDDHPAALGVNDLVQFSFHSTEPDSYFQCRTDDDDWLLCSSPVSMYLYEGSFVFEVRAVNLSDDDPDPTPASFSFVIDRTDPETTIDSGPDGTIDNDQASFTFSSDQSPVTFYCSIDNADAEECTSPKSYTGLSNGEHEFAVYAVNQFGFDDRSPETRTFTVNAPHPVDPGLPSNAFSFGRLKSDRSSGTATIQVMVPGGGKVFLIGSKSVKPYLKEPKGKGMVTLPISARGGAAKTLKKKGKVKVAISVRFTPTDGEARTKVRQVTLAKKKPKR